MPTVADVEIIAKTLGSILAGKPQRHGALTVIPILAPMQTEPEWLTLAEAGDRVRITEVDEEGSVPELRVANLGDDEGRRDDQRAVGRGNRLGADQARGQECRVE